MSFAFNPIFQVGNKRFGWIEDTASSPVQDERASMNIVKNIPAGPDAIMPSVSPMLDPLPSPLQEQRKPSRPFTRSQALPYKHHRKPGHWRCKGCKEDLDESEFLRVGRREKNGKAIKHRRCNQCNERQYDGKQRAKEKARLQEQTRIPTEAQQPEALGMEDQQPLPDFEDVSEAFIFWALSAKSNKPALQMELPFRFAPSMVCQQENDAMPVDEELLDHRPLGDQNNRHKIHQRLTGANRTSHYAPVYTSPKTIQPTEQQMDTSAAVVGQDNKVDSNAWKFFDESSDDEIHGWNDSVFEGLPEVLRAPTPTPPVQVNKPLTRSASKKAKESAQKATEPETEAPPVAQIPRSPRLAALFTSVNLKTDPLHSPQPGLALTAEARATLEIQNYARAVKLRELHDASLALDQPKGGDADSMDVFFDESSGHETVGSIDSVFGALDKVIKEAAENKQLPTISEEARGPTKTAQAKTQLPSRRVSKRLANKAAAATKTQPSTPQTEQTPPPPTTPPCNPQLAALFDPVDIKVDLLQSPRSAQVFSVRRTCNTVHPELRWHPKGGGKTYEHRKKFSTEVNALHNNRSLQLWHPQAKWFKHFADDIARNPSFLKSKRGVEQYGFHSVLVEKLAEFAETEMRDPKRTL
ncbi:hypothetical protein EK21DRAFT_90287 [Setomelanomma holmii]|uniref:Uncharacterized protein n=1 Tax=Setomelanomma holmii TaxID=210430 RepID=A0A9P4H963_9PLEO|nr:hypothetical protein EK21DRAFT_90287 [Setomelanomma holmii]